ncbi:MAG TPA: PspA/IM30 family protein [Chloroflexota bacterium]|nr:PspA/IM30 family protein [Chloroflexota bacterium]
MASVLGRISTIFKAKMNATLDAAENPNETLDLSYEQQVEQLQKVRRGIADVVTAKSRLELQLSHIQQDSAKFDAQARQALSANREDLARLALSRKADLGQQVQSLQAQVETLQGQQEQLQVGEQRLAAKIESFRTRKETIKAQYTAAQAQVRIGEAASGLSEEMADVNAAVQRAQDKTEAMQARANAIGELTAAGTLPDVLTGGDDLQTQLDQISVGSSVDAELAAMKAQLGQGAPPPPRIAAHTDEVAAPSENGSLVVRVQGRGQYRLAPAEADELHGLDHQLAAAVHAHNEQRVHQLLSQMAMLVQTRGSSIGHDELVASSITLPPDTITVEEVQALLHDDSLLEGTSSGA